MKLTARFRDALVYATELHVDQLRKASDTPYIAHLLGVTSLALEHGADEDEAIAALLHDAVEDQGGQRTADHIRRRFGERVLEIVLGCTDADTIPKPPWRERKEAYIAHLEQASPSVWLIAAADKLHNARSVLSDFRQLGDAVWSRFNGGREGTLWYYRTLADKLRDKAPPPLAEELERVVNELETEINA
ncbi:MAG: HD domain-containing protein [Pirellulales bacterium]